MEVMRQIEGAYALIFKSPHYPNELVACKCGSPLLLGVKVFSQMSHPFNSAAFQHIGVHVLVHATLLTDFSF